MRQRADDLWRMSRQRDARASAPAMLHRLEVRRPRARDPAAPARTRHDGQVATVRAGGELRPASAACSARAPRAERRTRRATRRGCLPGCRRTVPGSARCPARHAGRSAAPVAARGRSRPAWHRMVRGRGCSSRAACIANVEPPDTTCPARSICSVARSNASGSTPGCHQKCRSSTAISRFVSSGRLCLRVEPPDAALRRQQRERPLLAVQHLGSTDSSRAMVGGNARSSAMPRHGQNEAEGGQARAEGRPAAAAALLGAHDENPARCLPREYARPIHVRHLGARQFKHPRRHRAQLGPPDGNPASPASARPPRHSGHPPPVAPRCRSACPATTCLAPRRWTACRRSPSRLASPCCTMARCACPSSALPSSTMTNTVFCFR